MIKLVVFDLDGTLAESKTPMDKEMSSLLVQLLKKMPIAVISGGAYKQFQKQFLGSLDCPEELLSRLHLFPTCSTSYYRYEEGWQKVYSERFTDEERMRIFSAFDKLLYEGHLPNIEELYGDQLEDRGSQMTFSALGQEAPVAIKKKWDPDFQKRLVIKNKLEQCLQGFEIRVGGATSIDVTREGIDKAYGIGKMEEYLGFTKDEMIFVGDALFEGGNDYAVKAAGVESISVEGPEDTKKVIENLLS